MKDKNNLFDIMQNYKPTDDIFTNNATKEDIERVKFLVYQKKGKNYMKYIVSNAYDKTVYCELNTQDELWAFIGLKANELNHGLYRYWKDDAAYYFDCGPIVYRVDLKR